MSDRPDGAGRHDGEALIGPNAVLRMFEAITARRGDAAAVEVATSAGLLGRLRTPPRDMVPEAEIAALHDAAARVLGPADAAALAAEAGARTARYLLAVRIPRPAQRVLRLLPARAAAVVLLAAIARNAWTFCGSARFAWSALRKPARVLLEGGLTARAGPGAEPLRAYYASTFEYLFRALVHPRATVRRTGTGAPGALRLTLSW